MTCTETIFKVPLLLQAKADPDDGDGDYYGYNSYDNYEERGQSGSGAHNYPLQNDVSPSCGQRLGQNEYSDYGGAYDTYDDTAESTHDPVKSNCEEDYDDNTNPGSYDTPAPAPVPVPARKPAMRKKSLLFQCPKLVPPTAPVAPAAPTPPKRKLPDDFSGKGLANDGLSVKDTVNPMRAGLAVRPISRAASLTPPQYIRTKDPAEPKSVKTFTL